jgi:hypothetical protein
VIVCPLGAAVSSVIVIVSLAVLPALSMAVMFRAPGLVAPLDQLLSAPLVDQPLTPLRSGYVTVWTAVWLSLELELRLKLPVAVER